MNGSRVRSLVVLVAVIIGAAAWFGLPVLTSAPNPPVAAATPTRGAGSTAAPSQVPTPTTTLRPADTAAPSPTALPSQTASGGSTAAPNPTASATGVPTLAPSAAPAAPVTGPSTVLAYGLPSADRLRATPALEAALTLRLDELRGTYGLPGVSAAILFADGSRWVGTTGLADVENIRSVTPDTAFAIASISKTFLAALILGLIDDGVLALDHPVTSYLPELSSTIAIDDAITIRQLLDHTSGLHDFFYAPDIDEALLGDRAKVWTAQEVLSYVGKPYFKPGRDWRYSNTNYVILGLLAEAASGQPLAAQLRARFFDPLGLVGTHYQGIEDPPGPQAFAYRFLGPGVDLAPVPMTDGTTMVPFTSVVTAAGSAGSIASTSEDLVTWARHLYGGRVLTAAGRAAMVEDIATTAKFKPSTPYGLGVQAPTIDGRPTLGHSGRLLGSRGVVRWLPDEGIAIAVLTNQSRTDPNVLVRDLLRVVLGPPPD